MPSQMAGITFLFPVSLALFGYFRVGETFEKKNLLSNELEYTGVQ